MAKEPTHPPLYGALQTIEIKTLVKGDYLTAYGTKSGLATWRIRGHITAKIRFVVEYSPEEVYLELSYTYNNQPYIYRIPLEHQTSNLSKGTIWFFRCPITSYRCRKLYLCEGRFSHRKAIHGMYEAQTYSKRWRSEKRIFEACLNWDDTERELFKPHAKQTYRGKITRRTSGFHKKLNKFNKVTEADVKSVCHF